LPEGTKHYEIGSVILERLYKGIGLIKKMGFVSLFFLSIGIFVCAIARKQGFFSCGPGKVGANSISGLPTFILQMVGTHRLDLYFERFLLILYALTLLF